MADFEKAFYVVMGNEGGYSNNPNDTGGETFAGISRKNFPNWEGWNQTGEQRAISVRSFYKKEFWDKLYLDSCASQKMATELFDTGVNQGKTTAAIFFQRVLNVINTDSRGKKLYDNLIVDGIIGRQTMYAYNSLDDYHKDMCFKLFNCLQGARYILICENNPSQEIFMMGWSSRVSA